MASKAGGGIRSNQNVRPPQRLGAAGRGVTPGYSGQLGSALGNKAMNDAKRLTKAAEPMTTRGNPSVKLGNEVAAATVCGPGGSRTIYGTAGQGQHGPVAGTVRPPGRGFDERGKGN